MISMKFNSIRFPEPRMQGLSLAKLVFSPTIDQGPTMYLKNLGPPNIMRKNVMKVERVAC